MEADRMLNTKKIMAMVLVFTTVVSSSSCSLAKRDPEEIVAAADTIAKCVQYLDAGRLLDNIETTDYSVADAFRNKLTISDLEYDQASVKYKIAETITYDVVKDSVIMSRKDATCDVIFTRVDYQSAFDGFVGFSNAHIEQLEACDKTLSFTVPLSFNKVDGRWIATADTIGKFDELYSFLDEEFVFGPSTMDLIDTTTWMFAKNGSYENCIWIELDLWFLEDPEVNAYYVVSKDGEDIYTSEPKAVEDTLFEAPFNSELGAPMTENSCIEAGTYNIKIYREDGLLLIDESIKVTTTDEEKAPLPDGPSFTINDGSFADIESAGWWDYDSTMASDDVYCIDTKTIAFSIKLKSGAPDLYYAYYFVPGENAKASQVDYSQPEFSSNVTITKYPGGTAFFDIDYEPVTMKVGTYVLLIAADEDSLDEPYIKAVCSVIPQASDEFN